MFGLNNIKKIKINQILRPAMLLIKLKAIIRLPKRKKKIMVKSALQEKKPLKGSGVRLPFAEQCGRFALLQNSLSAYKVESVNFSLTEPINSSFSPPFPIQSSASAMSL